MKRIIWLSGQVNRTAAKSAPGRLPGRQNRPRKLEVDREGDSFGNAPRRKRRKEKPSGGAPQTPAIGALFLLGVKRGPSLLEQRSPLLGGNRSCQLLFGGGQGPPKTDHKEITDQMGADVLWPPAHVLLHNTTDSFADGGFDLIL